MTFRKCLFLLLILSAFSAGSARAAAPSAADRKLEEGGMLMEKSDFEGALKAFDEALRLPPSDSARRSAAYLNMGLANANLGRYDEAIRCFHESLRSDAEVPETHLFLGTCHRLREEWVPALQSLLEAVRLEPGLLRARDELWRTYDEFGVRFGFDRELIRREIYHLDRVLEADKQYPAANPDVFRKLKALFMMHNRLEESQAPSARVMLAADGSDSLVEAPEEAPPRLPEEAVSEEERLAAFVRARYR